MAKPTFTPAETTFARLADLAPIVPGAIVSKGLLDTPGSRQVLFAMDEGQQLSEHSAVNPATVLVITGRLHFKVPSAEREMAPGDFIVMKAAELHSVVALEPTLFLLTLLKQ